MIQIYSLKERYSVRTEKEIELGLYHGGLLFIAENGDWGMDDYVQLTAESARELAAVLNLWADNDDKLNGVLETSDKSL